MALSTGYFGWEGTMNPGGTTMIVNVEGMLGIRTRIAGSHLPLTKLDAPRVLWTMYTLWFLAVVCGLPFAPRARARAQLRSPAVRLPTIHSRGPECLPPHVVSCDRCATDTRSFEILTRMG